jgi:hypothetical protein
MPSSLAVRRDFYHGLLGLRRERILDMARRISGRLERPWLLSRPSRRLAGCRRGARTTETHDVELLIVPHVSSNGTTKDATR